MEPARNGRDDELAAVPVSREQTGRNGARP